MSIYERIKIRREQLGLSQDELAKKMGYKSRSSINKIELGKSDIPQSKIKDFSKALDTTPAYLMGWEDNPDQTQSIEKEDTTQASDTLSADESELVNRYRNLPESKKKAFLELLKGD